MSALVEKQVKIVKWGNTLAYDQNNCSFIFFLVYKFNCLIQGNPWRTSYFVLLEVILIRYYINSFEHLIQIAFQLKQAII